MLESVREFAAERLDDRPDDAGRVRSAHAEHYAAWAASRRAEESRTDREEAVAAIAVELENLRAAWRWSVATRDLGCLEALQGGLRTIYEARGWYRAIADLATDVIGVLETLERTPEREVLALAMRSDQARALTAMDGYTPEVEAAYERLLETLDSTDVPQVYPILRALGSLFSFRNEHEKAIEIATRILRLGEEQGDLVMQVDGHLLRGSGLGFSGRVDAGMPDLEAGIAIAERLRHGAVPGRLGPDPRVGIHTAVSLLSWWAGRLDTSLAHSHRAVAIGDELGHPSSQGYALYHAALLRLWRGEPEPARELAARVVEHAAEHDLRIWHAAGTVILGASAVELELGADGLRWVDEGLERFRGLKAPPIFWPFLLMIRAAACARAGRVADGLETIDAALAQARFVPDMWIIQGDLLRASGRDAEAAAAYEQAVVGARGWGARMPELRAAVRACALDVEGGPSIDERRARVREVLAAFEEGLDMPELVAAREVADGKR
jgi:tetratricopeptide (TPR) repeat protein